MHVSEAQEIRVVVMVGGEPITVPKGIEQKLSKVYQECKEEQRVLQEVRGLKKEIIFRKIRKLVPEAPIPPILLYSSVQDDLFQTISMFADMCRHVHNSSQTWDINETVLFHHRFHEIEKILEMLVAQIHKTIVADKKTYDMIENLFQSIKEFAYCPCKRKLSVIQAQKILPSLTEDQKTAIFKALQQNNQIVKYYDLTEVCQRIIDLRKKGDKGSDQVRSLYTKATNLLGAVFSLCREDKVVTDTAQDMINAARRAEPSKSWIW